MGTLLVLTGGASAVYGADAVAGDILLDIGRRNVEGGGRLDDVKEVFAEARLPLIQGKPFADTLSFETGYRYSDYDLGFKTDTYKFGLQWAPVGALMFRGSYQRAVRSPNIQELFLQPRAARRQHRSVLERARRNARSEFRGVRAHGRDGSTVLQHPAEPVLAVTTDWSAATPTSIRRSPTRTRSASCSRRTSCRNFSATVDYFDIKADKRSIWLGNTGFIDDPILNTGSLQTTGLDAELNYRFDVGAAGSLAVQLVGTYTDKFLTEPLPGASRSSG